MKPCAYTVSYTHLYERYLNEYGMTAMEARLLSDSFEKAELLDAAAKQVKPKAAANWILSDISKYLNDKSVSLRETKMTADKLVALVKLIEAGTISGNAGKKVLPSMFETDETVEAIVDRMGLKPVSYTHLDREIPSVGGGVQVPARGQADTSQGYRHHGGTHRRADTECRARAGTACGHLGVPRNAAQPRFYPSA